MYSVFLSQNEHLKPCGGLSGVDNYLKPSGNGSRIAESATDDEENILLQRKTALAPKTNKFFFFFKWNFNVVPFYFYSSFTFQIFLRLLSILWGFMKYLEYFFQNSFVCLVPECKNDRCDATTNMKPTWD